MSPEELAEARHYAACYQVGYVHSLMHSLLDHIDQQAARIAALEAQVAALKKIAVEERKKHITPPLCNCKTCTSGSDFAERRKHFHEKQKELARTQLAKEHPEVDWK